MIAVDEGVALLVRDPDALRDEVARAAIGRESWYESPQDVQLRGPWRHHFAKRRRLVESILGALTSRPDVLVDAGCGDGVNLRWLTRFAERSFGTDYNLARLRRACRSANVDGLALADLTDWPLEDQSVDVIFCNHVLEHIPDDVAALRELRRALRPDGTLVLGTPNEGAAAWRLAYRVEPWLRRRTDHVHFYTADDLVERCELAGLSVRRVEHIGWGVPSFTIDSVVRRSRLMDDALERVGRRVAPRQASSLYLVLGRGSD